MFARANRGSYSEMYIRKENTTHRNIPAQKEQSSRSKAEPRGKSYQPQRAEGAVTDHPNHPSLVVPRHRASQKQAMYM